ncbi:unnamed protein product [Sympodiomycopsis kandeliae]
MSQRRSNRNSIVSSMGLAPRDDVADPASPPVWASPASRHASDSPQRSRSRMDSSTSKRSDRYDSDTVSKAKERASKRASAATAKAQADSNGDVNKIRAAGSANAVPRSASIRSTATHRKQPPLEPTPEEGAQTGAGGGILGGRLSKLFGGGGTSSDPAPASPAKSAPAEPATSYGQESQSKLSRMPSESRFFGLAGKKAAKPTPLTDGDSRRTRYNAKARPVTTNTSLSDNMTDLALEGDDDDDEAGPQRPLGLGRMSSREARTPRSRHQSLLPERVPEEEIDDDQVVFPSVVPKSSSSPRKERGSISKKRVSRVPSSRSRLKSDEAPRLPVLAVGNSNFSDLVGGTAGLEPDYADEAEQQPLHTRPRTAMSGHMTETDGEDIFEDVDPAGFPVTPNLSEQQRDDPFEIEAPDVRDDEEALPIVTRGSIATIGALPLAQGNGHDAASELEEEEDEIPSYNDTVAAEPAKTQSTNDSKLPALALGGASLGAMTGLGADKALSKERSEVSDDLDAGDETVPGAFGVPAGSSARANPPMKSEDEAVPEVDSDDEAEKRHHRKLAAAGLIGAGAAGAGTAAALRDQEKKNKKKKSKKSPREEEDAGLVAAPPLSRQVSPPPPDKPQKSKARKQKTAAAAAAPVATRSEKADDKKKNNKKKSALAAAGLGGGAAATAAAAGAARDPEYDSEEEDYYPEEPAILTDDDDLSNDDEMYDEMKYASKSSKKKPTSSSKKKRTPVPVRPTRRSTPVKNLSPVQRHYLLKALVSIQMQAEWEELEKLGGLTLYGAPFTPERPQLTRVKTEFKNEYTSADDIEKEADDPYANDDDVARKMENLHEPLILRHLFHTHLMTFPGLGDAPLVFWQKRIQVFFDEMAARNFSTSVERGEYSKRRFYSLAATRYLGGYFARGVGVRGQGELRGPGPGEKGSERWGVGKQWGKGTVKRGLDRPARIDQKLWNKIDNLFGDGLEGDVWRRAGRESQRTRGDWQAWKEQIIENESGLEETINFLDISKIRNLPPKYRNAEEWARNHAAYLLHSLFVTAPNSDSVFGVLKGVHALFPYWGAKQLLKYANAQVLIEGILNLLLARPAGAKSLLQRIATYVIGSEATSIGKEYIAPLRKDINDAELTGRIEEYVKRGNRPEGRALRSRAEKTGDDVLTIILLTSEGTPLTRDVQDKVIQYQHAFARSPYRGDLDLAYPASTPFAKENPDAVQVPKWDASRVEADEARKFAQLKLYLRECLKKRDREQAVKMASGALIPTIVKDFLQTVMYDVIKQIASTADLSGRLGDLQAFLDDLVEVKKKKDDSLQAWIALAARHENSLYYFVHECNSIFGPMFDWCQIGLDYMALSTTDPVHPADRSAKNIEVNLEELLQDSRLSDKDVELILEEVDELAMYTKWSKVAYELELRKNFLLARPDAATNSKLTEDDIPSVSMKEEIQDIDSLMRELMESEGVPIDDGALPNESRGSEAKELATLWFDVMDPLGQHLRAETDAPELKYQPKYISPPVPCLKYIRKAVPAFNDVLREKLPVYHKPAKSSARRANGSTKKSGKTTQPAAKSTTSFSKESTSKNKFSIF